MPVDRSLALFGDPLSAGETALVRGELAALAADIRRAAGRCDACHASAGERPSLHPCDDCRSVMD